MRRIGVAGLGGSGSDENHRHIRGVGIAGEPGGDLRTIELRQNCVSDQQVGYVPHRGGYRLDTVDSFEDAMAGLFRGPNDLRALNVVAGGDEHERRSQERSHNNLILN